MPSPIGWAVILGVLLLIVAILMEWITQKVALIIVLVLVLLGIVVLAT